MADKTLTYVELAQATARQITSNHRSWTAYLSTSSRLYKYPYSDQLLIHAQRPDATACAEYDLWNTTMRRYVRRGSKGIALIQSKNGEISLRHVFDVSDTGRRQSSLDPFVWSINLYNEPAITAMLEQEYGVTGVHGLPYQLAEIAQQQALSYWHDHQNDIFRIVDDSFLAEYDELNVGMSFRRAAAISISYTLQARCGLDVDSHFEHEDFLNVFDWNTPDAVAVLGTAISQISGQVLRQIERVAKAVERSLENDRDAVQNDGRLSVSEPDPAPAAEPAPEQVREDEGEVSGGTAPDPASNHAAERDVAEPPAGDQPDGEPTPGADDAGDGDGSEGDGGTEGQRSDAVDAADERAESAGRGSPAGGADLQLNFFDGSYAIPSEAEQIQSIEKAERASLAPFAFPVSQEDIDHILRVSDNTRDHRMIIVSEFGKQKSPEEMAPLLARIYHGGYGIEGKHGQVAAWFAEDGIRFSHGRSARYTTTAHVLPWTDAAKRIGEMLAEGTFATNLEVAAAFGHERRLLANGIQNIVWAAYDKTSEQGYIPSFLALKGNTAPDVVEKAEAMLADPDQLPILMEESRAFMEAYSQDHTLLRYRSLGAMDTLRGINELTLPRIEFDSTMPEVPAVGHFITDDEIDEILSGDKLRIYEYFTQRHTEKERVDFLKHEYGTGGRVPAVSGSFHSSESHDSKGIRLKKRSCDDVLLKWNKVAQRIDNLIRKDHYLSPEGKAEYERLQQRKAAEIKGWNEYNAIKAANPDDMLLYQVGDFFEMYGEDAQTAAKLLDLTLTTRAIPDGSRVSVCGIPAERLEQYIEKIRADYDVTISPVDSDTHERKSYTMRSFAHESEATLTAEIAERSEDYRLLDRLRTDCEYFLGAGQRNEQNLWAGNVHAQIGKMRELYHALPDKPKWLTEEMIDSYAERMSPPYLVVAYHHFENGFDAKLDYQTMEAAEKVAQGYIDGTMEHDGFKYDGAAIYHKEERKYLRVYGEYPDPDAQAQAASAIYTDHEHDEVEQIAQAEMAMNAPDRYSIRLLPNEGGITGIWDMALDRFYEEGNQVLRFAEQDNAIEYLASIQRTRGMEPTAPIFTTPLGHAYRVGDEISSLEVEHNETISVIDHVDEEDIWYTLPSKPEQEAVNIRRTSFERYLDTGYFSVVVQEQPVQEVDAEQSTDEQFANEYLIPGESTFEMDGRSFIVDSVDHNFGRVSLQDVTFENTTGFPIFRNETIDFMRRVVEQIETQRTAEAEPLLSAELIPAAEIIPENFQITDDHLGEGGPKTKYGFNVEAIRTLKQIEAEGRMATPEEQELLSRYVGWGSLPEAFDQRNASWANEYVELKSLLTPEEYEAAMGSVLNAHYTSPVVIRAIYDAVERMGFTSGNVLEPACGVGNFFGLLPESMQESRLYGVELDSISGRIAQQLYPQANITVAGFETTDRRDFYDLAVGNVPFGNYRVDDRAYNKLGFSIHNYFFAKALDQVRPGGVVAFVTSRYTLDQRSPEVRKYLAERAELLGAIRLPNNAFRANAGTEVVADIIFLQKRDRPMTIEPDWVHLAENEQGFAINQYFIDHPEMVLGEQSSENTQYGKQDFTVIPCEGVSLADQLREAVQHIHGEYTQAALPELAEGEEINDSIPADPNVKNYSYTIVDGQVYFRENSVMVRPDLNQTAQERVKGLVGLRDCVHELINAQLDEAGDIAIQGLQQQLNERYDAFTAQYGLINSRGNALAFSDDSSYYLLCSLEVLDDQQKLKRKADMFTKRTIKQQRTIDHVDTAVEALTVSISEKVGVDLPYMAQLSGKTEDELVGELTGVIFPLPETASEEKLRYVTANEYLSGNVRQKLREARRLAVFDARFMPNVEALEAAQPKDLGASEIDVRLGATWVDKDYIQDFMYELLNTPYQLRRNIQVHFSPYTAEWSITGKSSVSYTNVAAYTQYGTARVNAYKILEDTLNLRDVRVFDTVEDENGREKRVLNQKATTLAQQKQQAIKDAFRDWVWRDPDRRHELVRVYNERFNSIRLREFDGSHIAFAGMNPEITLREHQRNAVAHILYGGNTLLAHEVGAGKTFEMIAAVMESKRLGLCQKAMFVVPNHLTEQWASEFLRLYPSANILVTTKKDFERRNRQKFCARIATGDYDAVIIGHSQFERIPVSQERQERFIEEQIDEITKGIDELKRSNGEQFSIKQLVKTRKDLEIRLKKLQDGRKDDVVTFEQLGIDRLYVDEAHGFKNLFLTTKMRNVAGLSTSEAQKSSDMFQKCRYMDELTGGRGIVFATGTPVSNSMTELYTMQRYLQYNTLQRNNMIHFDAWASTFGETVTAIELAPEGTGYRARTRFAKFFNLPELMTIFKEVADIKTADQLHLPTPKATYETVVVQPTEQQEEMVQALSERAAEVHQRLVDPSVDNMLKITSDGRKLGLDQRLLNPMLPDDPRSKVNACVRNIHRIWTEGADKRLTQMVFCDLSTPKASAGSDQPVAFSVYDDIRAKLISMGVPAEEIAFIHDANTEVRKKELFARVRSGQVRVLMGSTQKMGAGTNCQDRLVALHDLDCPWRPGDLEQRAGRIVRQGNQNEEVFIYRYVTEKTFDAYLWQTVENKQKFISQIMTSKSPVRACEDVDETALSYAEIKALCAGDPAIKEKMDLDVDVARLRLMKADHQSNQYRLEDRIIKFYPMQIEKCKGEITGLQQDMQTLAAHPVPEKDFVGMEIRGTQFREKEKAGEALIAACKEAAKVKDGIAVGHYRGLDMSIAYEAFCNTFYLTLQGKMSHRLELGTNVHGNLVRIENALAAIPNRLADTQAELVNYEQQMEAARAEVGKPFPQEDELQTKSARLAELNTALNIDQPSSAPADRSERASVREALKTPGRPGNGFRHHSSREER